MKKKTYAVKYITKSGYIAVLGGKIHHDRIGRDLCKDAKALKSTLLMEYLDQLVMERTTSNTDDAERMQALNNTIDALTKVCEIDHANIWRVVDIPDTPMNSRVIR